MLVWATPTLHILTVMAMPFHTSASPPSVFMVCLTLVSPLLLLPQRPRNNLTKPNQTMSVQKPPRLPGADLIYFTCH